MYRCVAASAAGFIQQLAVSYIGHGHWFYVTGNIPPEKDPERIDEKIIGRYGLNLSKWARYRRRKAGLANVHYLRHGHFFIIIASRGEHPFFQKESGIRDVRRDSIRFRDYSIGYKKGCDGRFHPSVRIHPAAYNKLKLYFRHVGTHWPVEVLLREFQELGFELYAPVRRQVWNLIRLVNRERHSAALDRVPANALQWRRNATRVFAETVTLMNNRVESAPSDIENPRTGDGEELLL